MTSSLAFRCKFFWQFLSYETWSLTAVKMWIVVFLYRENGGRKFLRNVSVCLKDGVTTQKTTRSTILTCPCMLHVPVKSVN